MRQDSMRFQDACEAGNIAQLVKTGTSPQPDQGKCQNLDRYGIERYHGDHGVMLVLKDREIECVGHCRIAGVIRMQMIA